MPETTIVLRPLVDGSILNSSTSDGIALISITFSKVQEDIRHVTVRGISRGTVSGVYITLSTKGSPQTLSIVPDSFTGLFEATFPLVSLQGGDICIFESYNTGSGATATDRAVVVVPGDYLLNAITPQISNFDLARGVYAAGIPDRLVFTKSFARLSEPYWSKVSVLQTNLIYFENQRPRSLNIQKLLAKVDQDVHPIIKRALAGEDVHTILLQAQLDSIKANISSFVAGISQEEEKILIGWIQRNLPDKDKTHPYDQQAFKALASQYAIYQYNFERGISEWIWQMLWMRAQNSRYGVLFYDRLRYQPTAPVVGELIHSLPLGPGEEVQVRQTTETKRRTLFSNIQDQESEQALSLSSTWTTDVTSSLMDSSNFQKGFNFGLGMSGEIPQTGIGGSADFGYDVNEASNQSSQSSVNQNYQKSSAATARMRAQHKIQLEITNEETSGYTSTRTVRNANYQQPVIYNFYKIYQREQVTLERYNAQLCLRLIVEDPARNTRAAFLAGISKIDPNNAELYPFPEPSRQRASGQIEFTHLDLNPLHILPGIHDRWVDKPRDLRVICNVRNGVSIANSEYSRYRLSAPLKFTMSELQIEINTDVAPIGAVSNGNNLLGITQPSGEHYVDVDVNFLNYAGKVKWKKEPVLGDENADFNLSVSLPFKMGIPLVENEAQWIVYKVSFQIETQWEPDTNDWAEFRGKILEYRQRLIEKLQSSPEQIYNLAAIAENDYYGQVISRALSESLSFSRGYDISQFNQILDFPNGVVESIPYWVTESGRTSFTQLQSKLLSLPIPLSIEQILKDSLTASCAVVYIPVREGQELKALSLLKEVDAVERLNVGQDLIQFRKKHYGMVAGLTLPTYDQIMGPSVSSSTPASSTIWQHDWEKPQRKFDVLAQWYEDIPTDGLHVEVQLSATSATDLHGTDRLRYDK